MVNKVCTKPKSIATGTEKPQQNPNNQWQQWVRGEMAFPFPHFPALSPSLTWLVGS